MSATTTHESTAVGQTDLVTVLTTAGPLLTKVYRADGTIDAYDDAASFKVKQIPVYGIRSLSKLLEQMESRSQSCLIRGKFVGKEKAVPGKVEGTFLRQNQNFDDQPLHFACIDVDGYKPGFADPVKEPELAVLDYIDDCLPREFKGVSFHWQLSSSAGRPGKEHILKAHVWFWLEKPHTSAQMYAWAKTIGPMVDKAVFRRVQVHYTASPIFEEGVTDLVPVRSGFWQGERDDVPLALTEELLSQAHATGQGQGGEDMKLVDPSEKPGIIGAFHRAFDAKHVMTEFLEGFEEVTERRWTWHEGGGTPEGVWVHNDGMHVGSSHNTWPIDGIANLWDVVRVFKFGDLDKAPEDIDDDDFERLNIEQAPVGSRPSDIAMLEWAGQLPELQEIVRQERQEVIDRWLERIGSAAEPYAIEKTIAPGIAQEEGLSVTERERLAVAIQGRLKELVGVKIKIDDARKMVKPSGHATAAAHAPDWAKNWVWITEDDGFMNVETKQIISERSYNARFDRFMGRYADENGTVPRASELALTVWDTQAIDRAMYLPCADAFFTIDGIRHINTYRADLAPATPETLTKEHLTAITVIERHAEILVPDARERRLMLDFIAYCVKKPGAKIRWAILLKGIPGDGKTAFATLLAHVMGHQNVKPLNSSTLEGSDFSGWSTGQCVVTIEEVKLHGQNRYDVYNKLKPYISNDVVEVHRKGKDPYSAPNTSNYFMLTNHDDALPVDDNDRRVLFLRSPFASKEQLFKAIKERTGLAAADYYDQLFDEAIKKHPGALRKWLLERELSPEFRADGRAPVTAARDLVVDLSRSDDELAVMQELETGGCGVYPDLVSATHLVPLVKSRHDGLEVRTRRVSTILSNLGFTPYSRIKWRGENCRIYFRGDRYSTAMSGDFIRDELERLEEARNSVQIEEEFQD